ncbi:MAG: energy transducer TonB [Acidobacteriaceae bacterium]
MPRRTKFARCGPTTIAIVALAIAIQTAKAQPPPCGLSSMTETTRLIYPPIAKAAHLTGTVILLVRFGINGSVENVRKLSGNPLLQKSAADFVRHWQANKYSGPRECPIVVNFELTEGTCGSLPPEPTQPFTRIDMQHVTAHAKAMMLCDEPLYTTRRKKKFLIF